MNTCLLAGALLAVGQTSTELDLDAIPRSIRKEPAYVHAPAYCLFVFGPDLRTRVWTVLDGNWLYVDRNGDGDLTDPAEKITKSGSSFALGSIVERDGKVVHQRWTITMYPDGFRSSVHCPRRGRQMVGPQEHEKPRFASRVQDAPIIQFDGPLALRQYSSTITLPRGAERRLEDEDAALRLMLGTPGVGKGAFAACGWECAEKRGPIDAEFDYPAYMHGVRFTTRSPLPTFS